MNHRCLQLCTADIEHKVEKVISEETTAGENRKRMIRITIASWYGGQGRLIFRLCFWLESCKEAIGII